MKGIAHFLTGVALATCVPGVVPLAQEGSLLPVLGGIAGLLPDLLDFRLVRYLEHCDVEIDPAPVLMRTGGADGVGGLRTVTSLTHTVAHGAAEYVADAFAEAMYDAYTGGVPRRLIAHTVRCGADLWRRYTVRIDPETRTVAACMGPLVTTSQNPVPSSASPGPIWVERRLEFPILHDYQHTYPIDIFSGPSFLFVREQGGLAVHFLDWHHRWTHSLLLAVALGVITAFAGGWLWGGAIGRLAGLISALAYAAHVLEDQLGHMGCNLLWPLTRRRQPGLGLLHSSDVTPNFLTTWTALILILYNLYRASAVGGAASSSVGFYLAMIMVAPWVLYGARVGYHRLRPLAATDDAPSPSSADRVDAERLAESRDGEAR